MPPSNPAEQLLQAPIADLVSLLMKQFKRLLDQRDVLLTTADIEAMGQSVASGEGQPPQTEAVRVVLRSLIEDSLKLLNDRFGLDFASALNTSMGDIGGWETTEEFIDIANEKSNAELRISAGASLLAFLGDPGFSTYLCMVLDADNGADDVDAAFARRALLYAAGLPADGDLNTAREQFCDNQSGG